MVLVKIHNSTVNDKGEFMIGYQDKEGFPWWVKCAKCNRKHNVSNLSFCSIQCQECKQELVNPLHEPFHINNECHAPIMENDSDYSPSDTEPEPEPETDTESDDKPPNIM